MGVDIRQARVDFGNPHRVCCRLCLGLQRIIFDIGRQHGIQQADIIGRRFLFHTADTVMRRIVNGAGIK
ncbi:MAG: Uncharacterised protein [SAR116 cluster bacterium]|nr:MAG: Uncharacterised protein [SAR116 cluster bacterium]